MTDLDHYRREISAAQARIFELKLIGLGTKAQIEEEKNRGLQVDLQTEELKTDEKIGKRDIQQVKVEIVADDLDTIRSRRGLLAEKNAVELDGFSQEISLLKDSIAIRLQILEDKNIRGLLGE